MSGLYSQMSAAGREFAHRQIRCAHECAARELPSAVPMSQAALYQFVLDRRCGEYELPGAALIACGNREASGVTHLEIRVDAADWCAGNDIAPDVLFFIQMRPELLHAFNPQSTEKAFPCPRPWEFASNIVHPRNGLDPACEGALFRVQAKRNNCIWPGKTPRFCGPFRRGAL